MGRRPAPRSARLRRAADRGAAMGAGSASRVRRCSDSLRHARAIWSLVATVMLSIFWRPRPGSARLYRRDGKLDPFLTPDDGDGGLHADRRAGESAVHVIDRRHRVPADGDDRVAFAQVGPRGGALGLDGEDLDRLRARKTQAAREATVERTRLCPDPEPGAPDTASHEQR